MASNAEWGKKVPVLQLSGMSQKNSFLLRQEDLHSLQYYIFPVNRAYSCCPYLNGNFIKMYYPSISNFTPFSFFRYPHVLVIHSRAEISNYISNYFITYLI